MIECFFFANLDLLFLHQGSSGEPGVAGPPGPPGPMVSGR